MQTFAPFPDFERTAEVLDDRRLGKQRVEALQIIRALTRPTYGWQHHPAVLMWKGHVPALALYATTMCDEWTQRGRQDTCAATIRSDLRQAGITRIPRTQQRAKLPTWWGDEALHRSHRSNLLRKDPTHYRRHFEPDLPDDLEYVWPVRHAKESKPTQPN